MKKVSHFIDGKIYTDNKSRKGPIFNPAIGVDPTKLIATTSLYSLKASTASLSPLTTLKN